MNFNAEVGLLRNLCSKSDQNFCEAMNIWGNFLKNISEINSWDDEKRKEFEDLTEEASMAFKKSMEQIREYLVFFGKKLDELEGGV